MKKIEIFFVCVAMLMAAVSCKKELDPVAVNANAIIDAEEGSSATYLYVLNEGVWGGNDASLDRITLATGKYERNVFGTQNGRDLGDVANDMQIYGSKMYIVVNNSNTLEVVDPESCRSIRQISEGINQPRYVVGAGAYVYVSSYSDLVYKIDTATFSVVATCNVGRDPEMMAVVGQKLYVVNSGGLDNPNYDTTISIVDLDNFTETKKVSIGINPTKIINIDNNHLLIICNGDYADIPSSLAVLDVRNESVTKLDFSCTNLLVSNGYAYCYDYDWTNHVASFFRVKLSNMSKETLALESIGNIVCPYGLALNNGNGNIYVTDSRNFLSNGDMYCFSATGKLRYTHECGIGPSKVVMW